MNKILSVISLCVIIVVMMSCGIEENLGMQSKKVTFIFGNGEVQQADGVEKELIPLDDIECVEIIPLEKIVINDVSIPLGMDKSDVIKILGLGIASGESYRYYENELGIYYNSNNKIVFIEFCGGIDGQIKPIVYGVPVFDTKARELTSIIEEHNSGNITYSDEDYELDFTNISVGVYRDITPEDVESMVKEMNAEGVYDPNDEDLLYDMQRAEYWGTIGIGVEKYYDKH